MSITLFSTDPKINVSNGFLKRMQGIVINIEIRVTEKINCFKAWLAFSFWLYPKYWAQMMAPPVAMAANILMIKIFNESTRETAKMAAEPMLVTIMVSTEPIHAVKTCSNINGINNLFNCSLLYIIKTPKKKISFDILQTVDKVTVDSLFKI